MSLLNPIKKDISGLCSLVDALDDSQYVQPLPSISGATVGQHVRHMLEFYSCILLEAKEDLICYDNRKRDLRLETERAEAGTVAGRLLEMLEEIMIDKKVCVQANYSEHDQHDVYLSSTLFRELAYALDHSIHHQAMVNVGLTGMPKIREKIGPLGVAPATLRHQRNLQKTIL